jgi:hypothetical protein
VARGPAALLAAYALALAYFVVAPGLPSLSGGDTEALISNGLGLALLGACALALVGAHDEPWAVGLLGVGGGILAAALRTAHVGPAANVFLLLFAGAAGILFARALSAPPAFVAVPLLVAGIDAWSVFGASGATRITTPADPTDFLVFQLPAWGGSQSGQLALSDLGFLATFVTWAWQFDLRRRVTGAALAAAPVLAVVLEVELGRAVPVLAMLAVALLVPNLDRIPALFSVQPGAKAGDAAPEPASGAPGRKLDRVG